MEINTGKVREFCQSRKVGTMISRIPTDNWEAEISFWSGKFDFLKKKNGKGGRKKEVDLFQAKTTMSRKLFQEQFLCPIFKK